MREPWAIDNKEYVAMAGAYDIQYDDEFIGKEWLDSYLTNIILDAKYEKVDVQEVASQQKHVTISQQRDLEQILEKHKKKIP